MPSRASAAALRDSSWKLRTRLARGNQVGASTRSAAEFRWELTIRTKGGGSDSRRKAIIDRRLRDEGLFKSHHGQFKGEFVRMCQDLESRMQDTVAAHMLVLEQTLDMLRNENVALESERDPEFRRRVADEIERVKETLVGIQQVVEGSG